MTELSGLESQIRNDRDRDRDKNCNPDRWQGWVRTLWPVAATVIALFMAYQSLESRVTAVEQTVSNIQIAIGELQDAQSETNVQLGVLNTNITNLNTNVTRIVNILDEVR